MIASVNVFVGGFDADVRRQPSQTSTGRLSHRSARTQKISFDERLADRAGLNAIKKIEVDHAGLASAFGLALSVLLAAIAAEVREQNPTAEWRIHLVRAEFADFASCQLACHRVSARWSTEHVCSLGHVIPVQYSSACEKFL